MYIKAKALNIQFICAAYKKKILQKNILRRRRVSRLLIPESFIIISHCRDGCLSPSEMTSTSTSKGAYQTIRQFISLTWCSFAISLYRYSCLYALQRDNKNGIPIKGSWPMALCTFLLAVAAKKFAYGENLSSNCGAAHY